MRFWCWVLILLAVSALSFDRQNMVRASTIQVQQGQSIQAAIDTAVSGDTILVSTGTYNERLTITKSLHLLGASKDSTIIDGQAGGTVVFVNSSDVEISRFTVRNSDQFGWGIHVEHANGVNITGNIVSASTEGDGVNLYSANRTLVSDNVFMSNLYAVNVTSSTGVKVLNNVMAQGNKIGVQLQFSDSNLLFNNTFASGEDGVDIIASSSNNVTRNVVRNMSLFGILMESNSPHDPVSEFPHANILIENTFQGNRFGVNLQNATMNTFYHNDFIARGLYHVNLVQGTINQPNEWDNVTLGGARGGNYWDNYNGTDTNGDGIGDTDLPANGVDSYPLMAPFLPVPVFIRALQASVVRGTVPLNVSFTASVLGSLRPFSFKWNFGDGSSVMVSQNTTHVFGRAGNFTVSLVVTDLLGETDSESVLVQALGPVSTPGSYIVPVIIGVVAGLVVAGVVVWYIRRKKSREKTAALVRPK